ncbi:MAG: hypothetical protein GC168_19140 [Candidatus Hydrogenedens sp.]|nr:hypothetical protein [Candidatus Hydrogenedens sp.]
MGTRKKVLLASLVSLAMVLAFVLGALPGYDATRLAASPGDSIDMEGVLAALMSDKGTDPAVGSNVTAVVIKTPVDGAGTYAEPEIPLPLTLGGVSDNVPVRYVASFQGDNVGVWSTGGVAGGAGTWFAGANRVSSDAATGGAPYAQSLPLGSLVSGVAQARTLFIYGLVNAQLQGANIVYSSATADPYQIGFTEVDGTTSDTDGNGSPDDVFSNVADGEVWYATVDANGNTVLVASLGSANAKGGSQVFTSPETGIVVEAPSAADLTSAGLISSGQSAALIVRVSDDFSTLLDAGAVDGDGEFDNTPAAWGDAVTALAPVSARTLASPAIDVSILVSDGSEIDSLGDSGLEVNISIDVDDATGVSLFKYPTELVQVGGLISLGNTPGLQDWTEVETTATGNTLTASVTSLSAFGAFQLPALEITGVDPSSAFNGEQDVEVTLTGIIPAAVALSAAEAAEAYRVAINGVDAGFRDVGGAAVSAYLAGASNAMYLYWDAAITTKATQSATIEVFTIDGGTETLADTITNAIDIIDTFSVTVDATTLGGGNGGSASVVTAPDFNGEYADGSSVAISASANTGFEFVSWSGLEGAEANTADTTITVSADRALTATFQAIVIGGETYTLNIAKAGTGSGTTTPATPAVFDEGTVVTITATPGVGSTFGGWSGSADIANPAASTTTITMNSDQSITATFTADDIFSTPLTAGGLDSSDGTNADGQVEVWLFGGEVVRITGTGLTAGADLVEVQVGVNSVVTADLFSVPADGTSGLFVIPRTNAFDSGAAPGPDGTDAAANLFVTRFNPNTNSTERTQLGDSPVILYKRVDVGTGVTTTAFEYTDPGAGGEFEVDATVGDGTADPAILSLPRLDLEEAGLAEVFGLVRIANETAKGNTGEIEPGPVGTGDIGNVLGSVFASQFSNAGLTGADTEVGAAYDLAYYLYGTPLDTAKANTGEVGAPAFTPSNGVASFGRGGALAGGAPGAPNPNGTPSENAGSPATFQVATNGDITQADVSNSLTVWGIESAFDYVTETLLLEDDPAVAYQSEIRNGDVIGTIDAISMRLYSLNGFSLRKNVVLPPVDASGVRLSTASGTEVIPAGQSKALTIVSPFGGLAWIKSAEINIDGGAVEATVTTFQNPGADEYVLKFTAPALSNASGIASITLKGTANNFALETINLQNVLEYRASSGKFPLALLLIPLLGALAALLGLAAGGDSGGGGGGPCFIATAAYGSPMADDINVLRDVRDQYLLSNPLGSAFVDTYYHISPAIADSVASSPVLAAAVRVLLVPVIFLGKLAVMSPALLALVAMSLGAFFFVRRKAARKS